MYIKQNINIICKKLEYHVNEMYFCVRIDRQADCSVLINKVEGLNGEKKSGLDNTVKQITQMSH